MQNLRGHRRNPRSGANVVWRVNARRHTVRVECELHSRAKDEAMRRPTEVKQAELIAFVDAATRLRRGARWHF
jgi:hypothetical protein